MQIAEILEAKLYNRNWVDEAKHIIADDKEDRLQRVSMDDAKEILQQFEEEFGMPQHIEEDNGGIGIWDYQWEKHIEVDGKWQRWFIKVGWYVPSKRGIVKVTRHRKYTDVTEAKYHRQKETVVCPECLGKGGKKYPHHGEYEYDACWTCDGKKVIPKSHWRAERMSEAQYHGLSKMVECPHCDGRGWEIVQLGEDDFEKDMCGLCYGEKEITQQEFLKRGYDKRVTEATHIGNEFGKQLRDIINRVPTEDFASEDFVVHMDYGRTIRALINALGEPEFESHDYGDDVPYWYLDNDKIVVSVDSFVEPPPNTSWDKSKVTVEYDPNGMR